MTISVRIQCIRKVPRDNPYERIKGVGGTNADGTRWFLPLDDAISGIESGKYEFYAQDASGNRVRVRVATAPSGRKYLTTEPDGREPNNLLSLPECP